MIRTISRLFHRSRTPSPHNITIDGSDYRYIDTDPHHQQGHKNPILIAPGWNQPMSIWAPHIERLATTHKRRVIMIDAPQGINMQLPSHIDEKDVQHIPDSIINKASGLIAILDALTVEKADVIAQSQGGIDALTAALLAPTRFSRIVLFNPAGMIGTDKLSKLMGRFTLELFTAFFNRSAAGKKTQNKKADRHIIAQLLKHPIKSIKAASAISTTQLDELIKVLSAQYGIQMICIVGENDQLFPLDKIQSRANLQTLRGFISIKGDHGDIFKRPKLYMGLANYLLAAMANLDEINT